MDDHGFSSECCLSIVNMICMSTNVLMINPIESFFATMVGGSMWNQNCTRVFNMIFLSTNCQDSEQSTDWYKCNGT